MEAELPNVKKWIVLYPVYINSKKTVAEGRRIGIAKACENPTCAEIGDCCNYLKLPYAIEVFFSQFFQFESITLLCGIVYLKMY
jgi:signal recognition particle subunit SRP19